MLWVHKDRSNLLREREMHSKSCEIRPISTLSKGKRLKREAREKLFTVSRAFVQYVEGDYALLLVVLEVVKADVISSVFAVGLC